ncbi:MAG: hypothetical protein ABIR66_01380, partial [Saprospiraceae bacterium]
IKVTLLIIYAHFFDSIKLNKSKVRSKKKLIGGSERVRISVFSLPSTYHGLSDMELKLLY